MYFFVPIDTGVKDAEAAFSCYNIQACLDVSR